MILLNISRDKRINAILYFCKNTKYLTQTKLYKLLYFLDFMHFREVGRPITDLEYFAWKMGPVPKKLYFEIQNSKAPQEILECIKPIKDEYTGRTKGLYFESIKEPNMSVFSDREADILSKVAYIFMETKADDMIEITHLKNQPWEKTKKLRGMNEKIDFFLSLDEQAKIDKELAEERFNLTEEMRKLFGNEK